MHSFNFTLLHSSNTTFVQSYTLTLFQFYTLPILHPSNLTLFQSYNLPILHSSILILHSFKSTLFQSNTLTVNTQNSQVQKKCDQQPTTTNQQPTTNNVDTRDPIGSKKLEAAKASLSVLVYIRPTMWERILLLHQ